MASNVERLPTSSGKVPTEVWRAAMASGWAQCRVGDEILQSGHLSPLEWETVQLVSLLDGAFFLLDRAARAVRAKLRTLEMLSLKDSIEDILITLGTQYHVIRPLTSRNTHGLFLYLVLSKSGPTWPWRGTSSGASRKACRCDARSAARGAGAVKPAGRVVGRPASVG